MCPTLAVQESMLKQMERLYELFNSYLKDSGLTPGELLPAGYDHTDQFGPDSPHSLFEPGNAFRFVPQVIDYWTQSKELPTVKDLRLWFENMEVSRVECTITLWSVVATGALTLLMMNGDATSVLRMLESIGREEDVKDTSPPTSPKKTTTTGNGNSSEPRPRGKKRTGPGKRGKSRKKNPKHSLNPEKPAGNSIPTPEIDGMDPNFREKHLDFYPKKDQND